MASKNKLNDFPAQVENAINSVLLGSGLFGADELQTRDSDRLDFHDVSITMLRQMLVQAYLVGGADVATHLTKGNASK